MPPWINLTVGDLLAQGHRDLVETAARHATALGQPDPLPELIQNTIGEINAQVGFRSQGQVDVNPTKLAPNLKPAAVKKIGRELKARLQMRLNADETADERTYQKLLADLRAGNAPVDATPNPAAALSQPAGGTGVALVTHTRRRMTERDLRGL
jgi:hypothetical protein